jgi:hypothetical protein
MKVSRLQAVMFVPLIVGCNLPARGGAAPVTGEVFPAGPYSEQGAHVPCHDRAQSLVDAKLELKNPPPVAPGDDAIPTTIAIVDRATQVDVVGVEIRRDGHLLYAALGPEEDMTVASFIAGDSPRLQARILLRANVRGGLFESLSYCYEHFAYTQLPVDRKSIELVVEDTPAQPARSGTVVRFDPPFPFARSRCGIVEMVDKVTTAEMIEDEQNVDDCGPKVSPRY